MTSLSITQDIPIVIPFAASSLRLAFSPFPHLQADNPEFGVLCCPLVSYVTPQRFYLINWSGSSSSLLDWLWLRYVSLNENRTLSPSYTQSNAYRGHEVQMGDKGDPIVAPLIILN